MVQGSAKSSNLCVTVLLKAMWAVVTLNVYAVTHGSEAINTSVVSEFVHLHLCVCIFVYNGSSRHRATFKALKKERKKETTITRTPPTATCYKDRK